MHIALSHGADTSEKHPIHTLSRMKINQTNLLTSQIFENINNTTSMQGLINSKENSSLNENNLSEITPSSSTRIIVSQSDSSTNECLKQLTREYQNTDNTLKELKRQREHKDLPNRSLFLSKNSVLFTAENVRDWHPANRLSYVRASSYALNIRTSSENKHSFDMNQKRNYKVPTWKESVEEIRKNVVNKINNVVTMESMIYHNLEQPENDMESSINTLNSRTDAIIKTKPVDQIAIAKSVSEQALSAPCVRQNNCLSETTKSSFDQLIEVEKICDYRSSDNIYDYSSQRQQINNIFDSEKEAKLRQLDAHLVQPPANKKRKILNKLITNTGEVVSFEDAPTQIIHRKIEPIEILDVKLIESCAPSNLKLENCMEKVGYKRTSFNKNDTKTNTPGIVSCVSHQEVFLNYSPEISPKPILLYDLIPGELANPIQFDQRHESKETIANEKSAKRQSSGKLESLRKNVQKEPKLSASVLTNNKIQLSTLTQRMKTSIPLRGRHTSQHGEQIVENALLDVTPQPNQNVAVPINCDDSHTSTQQINSYARLKHKHTSQSDEQIVEKYSQLNKIVMIPINRDAVYDEHFSQEAGPSKAKAIYTSSSISPDLFKNEIKVPAYKKIFKDRPKNKSDSNDIFKQGNKIFRKKDKTNVSIITHIIEPEQKNRNEISNELVTESSRIISPTTISSNKCINKDFVNCIFLPHELLRQSNHDPLLEKLREAKKIYFELKERYKKGKVAKQELSKCRSNVLQLQTDFKKEVLRLKQIVIEEKNAVTR